MVKNNNAFQENRIDQKSLPPNWLPTNRIGKLKNKIQPAICVMIEYNLIRSVHKETSMKLNKN